MILPASSRRRFLAASGGAALLAGCSHVFGPLPAQLYRLEPGRQAPSNLPPVAWRLAVAAPEAAEALDSRRIALSRTPATLDYFAGAAWTDRVPALLQSLLVQRFEDSGRIVAVAPDTDGLRADYLLATEIRDFEARYGDGDAPEISVRIEARLVRLPTRDILATLDADHRAPSSRNDLNMIVMAFDDAAADALDQIVGWTLQAPAPG